jgi:hypothetical protein
MAFRWLIYSTGTTYATTIVRESATNDSGVNEAGLNSDFVIPEIQPLYLWRVTGGTTVVPNTDANISAYLQATAPPPQPEDDASVAYVTGLTAQKIDVVTGATGNLGEFTADGNLVDSGYKVSDLTGGTTYNFVGSGGTQVFTSGTNPVTVTIYSTVPTGTTVNWGDITGDISNQTDLWANLTYLSGVTTGLTATKLDTSVFNSYTGTTETRLEGIEDDITGLTATKLDTSVFNAYTGVTQPVINAAITGVTNLGTGTTLGSTSGRNITLKSISVLGGLSLSGDADNLIISGGSTSSTAWGDITGTLSDQTDLWDTLTGMTATTATKLDTSTFNTYTGNTENVLDALGDDITYLSGQTDLRLTISDFNAYTGTTQPVIDAALTGATNGLTPNGRDVELGGALTKETAITGLAYGFTANTKNIHLQAINGINIIDTDGVGGVNIESDAGTISLIGNTSGTVERTKLQISETQMLITDSRTTPVGIQYAADYSATFTDESLITKRYADSIAAGLTVKKSVLVATTSGITLSGLTTIDGVALSNGDRVLVKNQATAADNGIYIASASTWSRAEDFNGNPSGEVLSGDLVPVISGATQYNTLWALVTPNPITVGVTDLDFTLFSSPHELIPGVGISILGNTISVNGSALAGNSIVWTGNTFNVDVTSGTLATALSAKLNVSDFNTFTGTTLPANYYNKTEINAYTGATDTRLDTIENQITGLTATTANKLDTVVFNAYTGATAPNEIFLIHTGGTDLNTIIATAVDWDAVVVSGSSFSWTGGTDITVLETADYEINYNIPYSIASNSAIGVGANIILNNATVLDVTAGAGLATRSDGSATVALPTVIVSLTADDVLTLATFRTHQAGTATSKLTGSILIKKKNTLQ